MRVFLCAFEGFSIAIPMNSIVSIALHTSESTEYYEEKRKTTIPIPQLFNLSEELIRHIIIIKNPDGKTNYTEENNIILLTTEVECEIDIPDERIYPLPKALSATRFSLLFSGIQFDSHQLSTAGGLVLLLNCEELTRFIQKEEAL